MSEPLPAGWVWSNLEETCASAGGGTPSKAEPAFWTNGTIPWVSPKDMKARVITSSEDRVTESALNRLTLIPTGSLLLVVRSGILSRTLPVAVTALPVTVNQDMRAFIPRAGMSSDFLAWQLIGKERDVLAATSKDGTTVASIEAPALASFPLAIAPTAEQSRIVSKLEELLSDLDAGVAELKAAQKKLQQYRQSLLKAAVEGSLTAAWREAHPAPEETGADLLARILRERRARWEAQQLAKFEAQGKAPPNGWHENYAEPGRPEIEGLPLLPLGWTWASLEQVAADEKYSLAIGPFGSNLTVPDYRDEGVPLVFVRNIRSGQFGGQSTRYVAAEKAQELLAHQVAAGDVLVTKMGEPPGDACVYPVGQPLAIITADCIKVRCAKGLMLPKFLEAVVNSHIGKGQVKPMTQGVAQKKVSLGRFSKLAVPVPPLQEQAAILQKLHAAEQEERCLTIALETSVQQSTAQRQNLLRAAFAGQLVPQDPADEPAAELLARIRAERAAHGAAKKPRAKPAHGAHRRNSVETMPVGAVE